MPKPDFKQIIKTLEGYSQSLKDNAQIGNSKLILAFAEMIRAMGWASDQADTNNIQIGNLTDETKDLKLKLATYSSKSDRYTRWLIWFTGALVFIGFATVIVTGAAVWVSYKTLEITTDPQIDVYLQAPADLNSGEYTIGIQNDGTIPVHLLSAQYNVANIYKNGCKENQTDVTCGGGGAGFSDALTNKVESIPFEPSGVVTFPVLVATSSDDTFINSISVTVNYERQIDRRRYTITATYFIDDDYKIYTLQQLRDIPAMQPFITSFTQFSATPAFESQKIYWQQ